MLRHFSFCKPAGIDAFKGAMVGHVQTRREFDHDRQGGLAALKLKALRLGVTLD
jgi:hypothetical protein